MSLAALVQNYGYLAVFAGTLLEGETVLVMAAFLTHRGYLELPWVMGVAVIGGLTGDQVYFYLGKRYGPQILTLLPRWKPRADRIQELLRRYHLPLILSLRFLYGLRTVGPMAIGMSHVSWPRFLFLDLIGACVWATVIAGAGYLFSEALMLVLADLRRYEVVILGVIALAGVCVRLIFLWRRRRRW